MEISKIQGQKKFYIKNKYKQKRRSKFHDIKIDELGSYTPSGCYLEPSDKIIYMFPQSDRYLWTWRDWKYDGSPSSKIKHKSRNVGRNKGESGGLRCTVTMHNKICFDAMQDIRGHSDFPLIYSYMDNSPKPIVVDETKPNCVVCYSPNR